MIYDVVCNYFEKMCESIDIPETMTMIHNSMDLDENDENSIDVIKSKLRELFSNDCLTIREFMENSGTDYPSLIMISRDIDPDFWTNQAVRNIQIKHQKLLEELDVNGRIKEKNLTMNLKESKSMLLRYFDLLPEEEDHDKELGIILLKSLKDNDNTLKLIKYTDINIITLIKISISLSKNFWNTNNGKQLKLKLLKFNSI